MVRQLSGSDVVLLKQLLKVFGEAFEDVATYQNAVPADDYLRSLLQRPHFIALVAMDGEEVIGGLAATSLIIELKRLASRRRAYVIYVQADKGDDAAIRLYESFGTREDVHHFDIPVDA